MNETLKFSWGHIFAFLAMIMISYITFTGAAYLYDTNLVKATAWALGSFIVLFIVFVGTQQLKSAEKDFTRCILLERIGVLLSIGLFALMITVSPFKHFWTVYGNKSEITADFAMAIDSSKSIFENYDEYVDTRIEKCMQSNSTDKIAQSDLLRLQLQPEILSESGPFSYKEKESEIIKWIDAAQESSVWNVFVIGNLTQIQEGVETWKKTLEMWSDRKFYEDDMEPYKASYDIKANFDTLKQKFTVSSAFQWRAILWALLGYFFMAMPWLLQRRPVKNPNSLFGKKKWTEEADYEDQLGEGNEPIQEEVSKSKEEDDDTFEI